MSVHRKLQRQRGDPTEIQSLASIDRPLSPHAPHLFKENAQKSNLLYRGQKRDARVSITKTGFFTEENCNPPFSNESLEY